MTAELRDLLDALGRDPDERSAVCHAVPGGPFTAELTTVATAPEIAAAHTDDNCWYSVQPLRDGLTGGRGAAADVTGLREIYADLDVKPGGMPSGEAAESVIGDLSAMLGAAPIAVVHSGHGLQPHWAVERGDGTDWPAATDPRWLAAQALLRRWHRLVAHVAAAHGGRVDNVYDLPRVLRVPGTTNCKDPDQLKPTWLDLRRGRPVSLQEIRDCLDAYNVPEQPEDTERLGEVIAPAGGWRYADRTCGYVKSMVAGWATDTPAARHPWLVGQATRLAAAHRHGCITEQDHTAAQAALAARFRVLLTGGDTRQETPGEAGDALAWGVTRVETMTDTKVARELGGHQHVPDASTITGTDGFWQARPILTHIRDFARARRASPWATLGAVLARVATATTPGVRLPPLGKPRAGGGEMSLNTFVALVGESGAGKDVAIETAAAAVDVGQVNVHGPGSGEGLSHLYVHRVKDEVVQHTVSVLLVAREVATLTALLGRQSSTLGGALRSAYTGAELGFSYADKDKRLPVPQHAYRLGLIVGVQPAMAGPLLDEAVSGTPQRFIWLPANDPQAPDVCPDEPAPVAWQRPTPATWPAVIRLCAATRTVIDKVRLDQLRSGNGHTLDSHSLLARLKVAAALGLLDGRIEVSDDDWQLAGTVMAVSDATRGRVVEALARQRAEANRARGEDEADRAVLVDERTAEHHVQRVAHNLVQRLRQHGDWVTHGELRRGVTSRDRRWFDDATDRAVKARQIEVEQVSGQGESGRRYRAVR